MPECVLPVGFHLHGMGEIFGESHRHHPGFGPGCAFSDGISLTWVGGGILVSPIATIPASGLGLLFRFFFFFLMYMLVGFH